MKPVCLGPMTGYGLTVSDNGIVTGADWTLTATRASSDGEEEIDWILLEPFCTGKKFTVVK